MKPGFWALFIIYFSEKKICWILIIFSTKFAIKIIGSSHMVDIGEICAWWVQKSHFCAWCVHLRGAPICGSYSPEHGDNPRYPNLEKIPRITDSSGFQRWRSTGVFSSFLEQNWDSLRNHAENFNFWQKSRVRLVFQFYSKSVLNRLEIQ